MSDLYQLICVLTIVLTVAKTCISFICVLTIVSRLCLCFVAEIDSDSLTDITHTHMIKLVLKSCFLSFNIEETILYFFRPVTFANFVKRQLNETCGKQECIPVGCVPPACWPYLPACTAPGGSASGAGGSSHGAWWCIPACTEAHPPLWTEWQTRVKT